MPKRYRSRAEWSKLVAELEAGDLTVAEFAQRHELNRRTLEQWWRRLRREGAAVRGTSRVPFVEVVQGASAPPPAAAWLEVGGVVVRFGALPTPGYLGEVARALARSRPC